MVVVVFISADYVDRDWTRLERRAAFSRASRPNRTESEQNVATPPGERQRCCSFDSLIPGHSPQPFGLPSLLLRASSDVQLPMGVRAGDGRLSLSKSLINLKRRGARKGKVLVPGSAGRRPDLAQSCGPGSRDRSGHRRSGLLRATCPTHRTLVR